MNVHRSKPIQQIPQFDLQKWRASPSQNAADTLCTQCHEIGFFLLTNHGLAAATIDEVFTCSKQFFDLPLAHRQSIDKLKSRHFRGWECEGSEYTNGRPDIREQIDLWSEHEPRAAYGDPAYLSLLGPNQWPEETLVENFEIILNRWFVELGAIADELMAVLAQGLGLDSNYFDRVFGQERMSLTKLIRYPKTPTGQFGVNAHHDAGFLTLLAPGSTPGLQIEMPDRSWAEVPIVEDALVVNLGEILQSMTGNYLIATPHRVVTNEARQSAGYFHGPSLEMPLDPLKLDPKFARAVAASPRHANAGFMARKTETEAGVGDMASTYRPSTYGEQLWNYFTRSYPQNMKLHYPASLPSDGRA